MQEEILNAGPIPSKEWNALHDLYLSTGGENWDYEGYNVDFDISFWTNARKRNITDPRNNIAPWNFTSPSANPCLQRWQGITCTCSSVPMLHAAYYYYDDNNAFPATVSCSVTKLALNSMNLSGYIPESFSKLTNLNHVHISLNPFIGQIPTGTVYKRTVSSDANIVN